MPSSEDASLRNPRLDGVRGLAILLVLLFHTAQYTLVRRPLDVAITAIPALGWAGVDLFFVLSGYLITGILLATRDSESYFRTFYARRTLRIFPLYYAVLVALLVIAPRLPELATLEAAWGGAGQPDARWYWLYLSNVEAARNGAFDHFTLAIAWSLAIEEQFYLVWPWLVRRMREERLLVCCIALVAVAFGLRAALLAAGEPRIAAYVLAPCRMDTLATGAAIAILARRPGALEALEGPARRLLLWGAVVFAAVVVALRFELRFRPPNHQNFALVYHPLMQTVGYSLVCLLWGALLVTVLRAPPGARLARTFELGSLRSLGKYSYGLYLLHLPVAAALALWFPVAAMRRHFVPAQIAFWVAAIGGSYVLARLSWLAIEEPFLRLKRYVPYRARATPP